MSLQIGDKAPRFELPEGPGEMVDVGAAFDAGRTVLLFYPFAFSPVCSDGFCHVRDHWSSLLGSGTKVFGISIDSPFVAKKFRETESLPYQLLADFNKEVATSYGVLHEDLMGLKGVAKRSAFVVESDGTISFAWVTDDPRVPVPFDELEAAVSASV